MRGSYSIGMAMAITTLVAITIATGSRSVLCVAAVATSSMHAESMLAVAYTTMACNLGIYVVAMARGADAHSPPGAIADVGCLALHAHVG